MLHALPVVTLFPFVHNIQASSHPINGVAFLRYVTSYLLGVLKHYNFVKILLSDMVDLYVVS